MKRVFWISLLAIALPACGSIDLPAFDSIFTRVPRVVAIEPADGETVHPSAIVALEFSERIDPSSVDASTLAILPEEEGQEVVDLAQALGQGGARGIEGAYEFAGEGRVAIFRPREPFVPGNAYRVIATAGIMSVEMLPLSNRPGRAGDAFISTFTVDGGPSGGGGAESPGAAGGTADGTDGADGGASVHRPSFLVINELLYDVPGDDTNGVLFVELYGEAGADIGKYRLVFVNGDDGTTTEEIKIPKGARIPEDGIFLIADAKTGQGGVSAVAGADLIDNFDPQNGPDCAELLDDQGRLVDALGYGTPIVQTAGNGLACFEGTPTPKAPAASSLTRTNGVDLNDNAGDFHTEAVPTPGVL